MGTKEQFTSWPPRDFLVKCIAEAVPQILDTYRPETGEFGTSPWVCNDQQAMFPLAAAWSVEHPDNPYYHSPELAEVIGRAALPLLEAGDEIGRWEFRKKDNSTWGMIHMPWTYSRWIRTYHILGDAIPAEYLEDWRYGLQLGYEHIAECTQGGIHNIPTHHAMGLYIAGVCFDRQDWKDAASQYMHRVAESQHPDGYWSENYGPIIGYNFVYSDVFGTYYHFSHDPEVLEAIERAVHYHSNIIWSDGSCVATIAERTLYHPGVNIGNVGFSYTAEGRGYLLSQLRLKTNDGAEVVDADYAANMLLYASDEVDAIEPHTSESSTFILGDMDAVIRREMPWQWAFSGYVCPPVQNRWIQDRHNHIDIFHPDAGLIVGGGNTKLQPLWSTFTVGDVSLLAHTPGDEDPNFTPEIDLQWVADETEITMDGAATRMTLRFGDITCSVTAEPRDDRTMALIFSAPSNCGVEAHIPFFYRGNAITLADGNDWQLDETNFPLPSHWTGGYFRYGGVSVAIPACGSLIWPATQHDPYTKDGKCSTEACKLVLALPFEGAGEYTVLISI